MNADPTPNPTRETAAAASPAPPIGWIMAGVFVAGVAALGYLHEAHADWPFTQQFLDGKRFWIAVSFLGFLCAMLASELRNWLAKRRARAAAGK